MEMDWTKAEPAPEPTHTRTLKGNKRLGHWLTDDPKVFDAFEREPEKKRPRVSLITTSADVDEATCMGLGADFARLYMDPSSPLTDEVTSALSSHKESCPFNNLHPSALPPDTPAPDPQDLTAAALLKLADACPLPTTKANDEGDQHAAEVQKKITRLQSSLSHPYDFTKDPPQRPMLLNYIDPVEAKILVSDAPLKPFLPQGKVGMFVAPGGTGKTQALSQLAVSVATGQPWLDCCQVASIPGKHPSNGRVLLALGEEDSPEISRRINPYIRHCLETASDKNEFQKLLTSNLKPLALDGVGPRMISAKTDGYNPEPFFDALYKVLEQDGKPWRLIILDPGSRFMGPDCETDNNAATRFIELLEQLTKLPGNPTVLLAHHTRKGTGKGDDSSKDASRGASALTDGARWVAQLAPATDDEGKSIGTIKKITVNKSNYTPPLPQPIYLQPKGEGRGQGYWLEPTEAPTVEATKARTPKALTEEVKKLRTELDEAKKLLGEVRAELSEIKTSRATTPPNYRPKV